MYLSISDWLALTVGIEQLEPHVLIIGHNGASGSQAHDSIHVHTAKAKQSTAPTPFMSSVGCLIFCFTFPLLFIRCPIGFPRPVLRSAPERSIDPIPLPAPPPPSPTYAPPTTRSHLSPFLIVHHTNSTWPSASKHSIAHASVPPTALFAHRIVMGRERQKSRRGTQASLCRSCVHDTHAQK